LAPLARDLPIRQIALSVQKPCAKNAESCVYNNRETACDSLYTAGVLVRLEVRRIVSKSIESGEQI
jgi:hypothetical protein